MPKNVVRSALLVCVTLALLLASFIGSGTANASVPHLHYGASAHSRYSNGSTPRPFTSLGKWRAVFTVDHPSCAKKHDNYFYADVFHRDGPEGDASNPQHATRIVWHGKGHADLDYVVATTCAWHVNIKNAKSGWAPRTKVFADCRHAAFRPRSIDTCGDGYTYFTNIKYKSYGRQKAAGTATLHYNLCEPSCAQGRERHATTKLTLFRVRKQHGHQVFTRARFVERGRSYAIQLGTGS